MGIHASIMGIGGSGPIPPTIATTYTTQDGNAVPSSNVLLVKAFDSTENNDNGIATKGGVAAGDPPGTGATNELDIYLTNRYSGSVTTTDDTPTQVLILSIPLYPAVYNFVGTMNLFDVTNVLGSVINYSYSFRTTDVLGLPGVPVQLNPFDQNIQEDPGTGGTFVFNINGAGQTFAISVTGVAATTMKWKFTGTFTVVS